MSASSSISTHAPARVGRRDRRPVPRRLAASCSPLEPLVAASRLVVVAHVLRLHQEDHVLGDVGGVVGDALQVAADQDQRQRPLDRAGVRHHVGEQHAEDLVLELVHLVVAPQHVARQRGVRLTKASRLSRVIFSAISAMRGMSISGLSGGCGSSLTHVLGDVHGLVADPLQVGVDLHGRRDQAQVRGHGLLQRQQLQAAVVDLDLQVVDLLVGRDDLLGLVHVVAPSAPARRWCTRSSTSAPMLSSRLLERLQLVFEMMAFHRFLARI